MSFKIPINLMSCLGLILSKKFSKSLFSIKALWAYIIHTYTNIKLYTKYPQREYIELLHTNTKLIIFEYKKIILLKLFLVL